MQHRVMFLPALQPIGTDRTVGERLATPLRGAVVSSVSSTPVETQGKSFGVLYQRRLILDTEVLEGGTYVESAPEVLVVGAELVLEIASWTRRFGRLR